MAMLLASFLLPATVLSFPVLGDRFHAIVVTSQVGAIHVEAFVGPDGAVDDCVILYSEFRSETGDRVCNLVRQKRVESPALDQHGQPIHGTAIYSYITTVGGGREERPLLLREPVLELAVGRLPAGVEAELLVGLRVIVGPDGKIEACEANTREADIYTRTACAQLGTIVHPARNDRNDQPVRHLTDMNVVFVLD